MISVVLGLGSNRTYRGKTPVETLESACACLSKLLVSPVFSSIYRTRALYVIDQDNYYNMIIKGGVSDTMTPHCLLEKIHGIEAQYGRDRSKEIRFGPRTLDIDIELFGSEIVNTAELVIPHLRMKERAFVLIPLLEILRDSADEVIREKYAAYAAQLSDQEVMLFVPASGLHIPVKAEK